jgi:site-specific recombinase XerD
VGLVKKRGWFYWVKAVPKRYRGHVLGQNGKPIQQVRQALGTQVRLEATAKASQVEALRFAEWEAILAGKSDDARRYYLASVDLAQSYGFTYQASETLLSRPLAEVLPRLRAAIGPPGAPADPIVTEALLGAARPIFPDMAGVLEEYVELTKTRHMQKSDAQRHKWLLPKKRAVANFNRVVAEGRAGPPLVDQITRADALAFRDFWSERVLTGTHDAKTANKDFGHLAEIYTTWSELTGFESRNPFKALRLHGGQTKKAATFSRDWVADRILDPSVLDGLNEEARDVLLVMINTGLRPSEITDSPLADYRISSNIPHLAVEPNGRQLKVSHTRREIPLVGVSLDAARRIVARGGIQRYQNKAGTWSALVNKYMLNNGLKETPQHTAYGLRHYVEDALLLAGVDDRVRADILGHKYHRPVYGKGGGLVARLAALELIAL